MKTPSKALLLALLLSLCCTLCCATSRTLQQDVPPATNEVEPAAATPQKPTCKWYPPAPRGIKMEDWTAFWPQQCMGTTVDRWCDAQCRYGYVGFPIAPRIYCDPQPDGTAEWAFPIKGDCVAFCQRLPPSIAGVSWPYSCNNGLIEGASKATWAPPSTCTGTCRDGYIGDPAPIAKCLPPKNGTAPAEWQIVQGNCIDNVCDQLPRRIIAGYWPSNCSRLEVGSTCEAICNNGFVPEPAPKAKCIPPNETYPYATWETDTTGVCRDNVCNQMPLPVQAANWPRNCSNSEVGATCTAECYNGFIGDPTPVATCTKPAENKTVAEWVVDVPDGCKDPTACRDDPCQDIAFAVQGSCVPTRGEKPSTPGSGQFSCTCFDYYKWNAGTKTCGKASLLAFAVARPVDITEMGARKRAAAVTQVAEASWIYKYGAKKASDIGGARWIAQDKGTSEANLFGVAVADAKTAWAVGSKGIIKRYNGSAWSIERTPDVGASTLRAVAALSSRKAWAGGANGVALYYDGASWRDVSLAEKDRTIQAITAVAEPDGTETVLAAAGDERNPNKLKGYIYKWDGQQWGAPFLVENATLRGITALDRYGAWACGFTNKGPVDARAVIMSWDHANQTWTRTNTRMLANAHFTGILTLDYKHMYISGYTEYSDQGGTQQTGFALSRFDYFNDLTYGFSNGMTGNVAKFNAIAGLSPSTTVAVGVFRDGIADQPPDGPSQGDYGFPAVSWSKYGFSDKPQKANVSIAYDLEVSGIGMQYV